MPGQPYEGSASQKGLNALQEQINSIRESNNGNNGFSKSQTKILLDDLEKVKNAAEKILTLLNGRKHRFQDYTFSENWSLRQNKTILLDTFKKYKKKLNKTDIVHKSQFDAINILFDIIERYLEKPNTVTLNHLKQQIEKIRHGSRKILREVFDMLVGEDRETFITFPKLKQIVMELINATEVSKDRLEGDLEKDAQQFIGNAARLTAADKRVYAELYTAAKEEISLEDEIKKLEKLKHQQATLEEEKQGLQSPENRGKLRRTLEEFELVPKADLARKIELLSELQKELATHNLEKMEKRETKTRHFLKSSLNAEILCDREKKERTGKRGCTQSTSEESDKETENRRIDQLTALLDIKDEDKQTLKLVHQIEPWNRKPGTPGQKRKTLGDLNQRLKNAIDALPKKINDLHTELENAQKRLIEIDTALKETQENIAATETSLAAKNEEAKKKTDAAKARDDRFRQIISQPETEKTIKEYIRKFQAVYSRLDYLEAHGKYLQEETDTVDSGKRCVELCGQLKGIVDSYLKAHPGSGTLPSQEDQDKLKTDINKAIMPFFKDANNLSEHRNKIKTLLLNFLIALGSLLSFGLLQVARCRGAILSGTRHHFFLATTREQKVEQFETAVNQLG